MDGRVRRSTQGGRLISPPACKQHARRPPRVPARPDRATARAIRSRWIGSGRLAGHSGRDIHDRFVLSDDELILLGHGLKDIGSKDSFIIRIGRDLAGDLIDTVHDSFETKWQQATLIV